jgi:ribosome recycling factor
LKKQERDHAISEDDLKRSTDRLQKMTDKYVAEIEEVARRKEHDVLEV